MRIDPYSSADELSDRDVASIVAIHNQCWDEWIPGEPPITVEAFRDDDRFTHAPEVVLRHLARDSDGEVVGFGSVLFRDGEPGGCVIQLFVASDRRRRGVGTALGTALVDVAAHAGRSGVTFEVVESGPLGPELERAGFRFDMVIEQNRAPVASAPEELLAGWVAKGEGAAGYSLVAYDGRCEDDDLAASFIEARHVMNDAPRWEGEPPCRFTVAELRCAEAACAAAHLDWWNLGVRHDPTGTLVGLSEMYLPHARPWIVFQGDTGVDPAHRGHGLGAWMKAVNHLRLRRERPEVQVVQTWNAAANAPMLRINRALGFHPVQRYQGWYRPLG